MTQSSIVAGELAELAMAGTCLSLEQCRRVLGWPDAELMALVHQAYRVRHRYFGNHVDVQILRNAKSGFCTEDCRYCSQSSVSTAEIDKYPLVSTDALLDEARKAKAAEATRFCMSLSGNRPTEQEIDQICDTLRAIRQETDLPLCGSLGLLTDDQAQRLRAAGLNRVNHNLNTSRRYYGEICTTHTFQDRIDTIERCRAAGLEICSGGIVGQGEADDDIIDMFLTLREIGPEAVPVNFLIPIPGTPLGETDSGLNPRRCLKVLALARFLNPTSEVRAAGGWEYNMRSLKPLALYVVDSIFATGYLTTGGTSVGDVRQMIDDMGFEATIENPQA